MEWRIAAQVVADIERHARDERPRECCGVLLGTPGRVVAARRVRNVADDPNRFELDPQGHVAAIRETRGTAIGVVGFYHSHPHSPAVPSPRDLAESTYPDALYLIAGVAAPAADGRFDIRAYHLRGSADTREDDRSLDYEEVPLIVSTVEQDRQ